MFIHGLLDLFGILYHWHACFFALLRVVLLCFYAFECFCFSAVGKVHDAHTKKTRKQENKINTINNQSE